MLMLADWEKSLLGEIAEYSKTRINTEKLTLDNYVSTTNMLTEKAGKVQAVSIPFGTAVKFTEGQTLVSNIRPYFKKIWQADTNGGCSSDVLVFDIIKDIDKDYFFYYLSQDMFFDYVMAGSKGTKMPRGDKQQILKFPFSYPEKKEQKAIAATLSCLDDKIELNNRMNQTLEEMAQAIFKSWFVDFEPFQDGEFVDSEVGRIPKGWRVAKLSDLNIVITDYVANGSFASLKKNVKLLKTTDYAVFIRNSDLKSNKFEKFVDEHSYDFLSKTKLFGGEVIISNVGDVGSVYLCPNLEVPMTLGNNMIMVNSLEGDYNYFLYFLFKYSYGQGLINSITGGSAQPKFNKTDFRNLKIILPSFERVKKFNTTVECLLKKQNKNSKQNIYLNRLRNTLLPKLMSGEVRVTIPEVE